MRIIYIADNYLDNNSGGSFANRAFINAFAEIADSLIMFYPDKSQNIRKYIHKKAVIKAIPKNKGNFRKLIDIYLGKINWYSKSFIANIKSFAPDIVVFDGSRSSVGLIEPIKLLGIKVITIHHNYEIEYFKGTPPPLLWRFPFMYYMEKAEYNAVRLSDLNLTLTVQDTELLKIHYDSNRNAKFAQLGCFESFPGSDNKNTISEKSNVNLAPNEDICFAITGSLSSYQTEISIVPFIKDIYPLLLGKFPNSRLLIAGRDPSIKIVNACKPFDSISIIPNPDDMQSIINQANVYICPTSVGGGIKLRIMDAFKAGLPVLTHVVSARGYDDFKNAGYLFEYEDQKTFEQSLEIILTKLNENNFDKRRIKELYDSIFTFEAGVSRLKELISEL